MSQSITWLGSTYSSVGFVDLPKTNGGTARFSDTSPTTAVDSDVTSGKIYFKSDGTQSTGTNSGGGSSKNVQVYSGYASRKANSYGATSASLTVSKTGTYKISWIAWRSSSSGTMGTNLHIGSTSESSNHETWTGTYGQSVTLSNKSLTADQTITIYATSGSSNRTIYVGNLIIEEQ